ncbi:MAG: hypothetical protein LLG06_11160 [Desulfobacteraceae bacterium]|nr:hypothetical protein [Desulfobacteraceae bacterium]
MVFLCAVPLLSWAAAPGGQDSRKEARAQSRTSDIVFQGKFFCSLVRGVVLPFRGTVLETKASTGQAVSEGDILARYELSREAREQIRRRMSSSQISELQVREAQAERAIAALGVRQRELGRLAAENLAPAAGPAQAKRELGLLKQELAGIQDRIRQEKALLDGELALLRHQLCVPVSTGGTPTEATLSAPIGGHVIWVHPDFRMRAELPAGTHAFTVGVMDPMVLKAHVHEIEAMQLAPGDPAEITLESIPGEKFEGTISRISWAPATPGLEQPSFYEVELTVANPRLVIRDGLKGQATVRNTQMRSR